MAQVKPVYFYGERVTNDKNKATSYAIYGKLSNEDLWVFKRYDLYDNLMQTGSYQDEILSVPHGKFTFYMDVELFNRINRTAFRLTGKTRFVSQIGTFVAGLEQGVWLHFFPDGNVLNSVNFVNGKMSGEFVQYDKYGKVEVKGSFTDGLKEGEWVLSKKGIIEIYEKDELKSTSKMPKERLRNE